jgi:pimeloyl-ACP methyl ester carboxylesterase
MSGGNYQVERMFARFFARHQLAVVIAHRLKWKVDLIPEALDAWFRQTVFENQLALDWIETRPELDADRIALFGISLGGIRGVLLAATDPRVKAAVLGLTGGDLPYILAHTTENGIAKKRDEYLRTNCVTVQQFQERLRASITAEPNDFAPAIDPQSVLLVLGVFDHVVPFGKGWELRRNMGRPETLLLPTGHYTAALMIPYIRDQSLRFFQKKFALPATAPPTLRLASPRGATSS